MTTSPAWSFSMPVSAAVSWADNTCSVWLFVRWSQVSPMHRIGRKPWRSAAATFLLTVASVSPKSRRRSEWPMITYRQPRSFNIRGDTAPVKAPRSSQCMSCADNPMGRDLIAVETAARAVNGGARTISTMLSGGAGVRSSARRATKSRASGIVLCIFQFPTISRWRGVMGSLWKKLYLLVGKGRDPRQDLAFQQFQRGAAAGGDEGHAFRDAGPVHGQRRVRAADDGQRIGVGHRVGDRHRAAREGVLFEDAHRAVPEDRLGIAERFREQLDRRRPDVQAVPAFGDFLGRHDLGLAAVIPRGRDDAVHWQVEPDATAPGMFVNFLGELEHIVLDERV